MDQWILLDQWIKEPQDAHFSPTVNTPDIDPTSNGMYPFRVHFISGNIYLVYVMAVKEGIGILGLLMIFVSNMKSGVHLPHRDYRSKLVLGTCIIIAVFHVYVLFGHRSSHTQS